MGCGGRGANGRGGHGGPHAFTASCSFALLSCAGASGKTRASDRPAGCPWGVPWGRDARVEVRRAWCVGGVVQMAAGGRVGLRAFSASCLFALLSFARASGMTGASGRAAGSSRGVPWGRGACVEVRQVWCVGSVVPMAAGGIGPSCLRRIMFSCTGVFCQGFRRGKGFKSRCWLLLGSAMGPRCACRGEAGVVRGGRGANGRGGHGSLVPSPHHVLLLCCLLQGPQVWQGLWIGLLDSLGERHGAEVRVLR